MAHWCASMRSVSLGSVRNVSSAKSCQFYRSRSCSPTMRTPPPFLQPEETLSPFTKNPKVDPHCCPTKAELSGESLSRLIDQGAPNFALHCAERLLFVASLFSLLPHFSLVRLAITERRSLRDSTVKGCDRGHRCGSSHLHAFHPFWEMWD